MRVSDATRRVYVIAGVYGCYMEFEQLLLKISDDGFDLKQDELVIVGPLLGMGPSVDLVFDKLKDLVDHKTRVTHVLAWTDAVFRDVTNDESLFDHLRAYEAPERALPDREVCDHESEHLDYMNRWAASGGHAAAYSFAERGKIAIPITVTEILAKSVNYYRTGGYLFMPAPVPSTVTSLRSALEELERDEVLCPAARHGRVLGDVELMALPEEDKTAFVVAGGEVVPEVSRSKRAALIDTGVFAGNAMTAIRFPEWKRFEAYTGVDYRSPIPYSFVRNGVTVL